MRSRPDDEDRRPDGHAVEEPLRVGDLHADAAVRDGVADRGRVRRAVDADERRRQPHPPRAERVSGPGRDRLLVARPVRVRRGPPGVPPLDHDAGAAQRRRGPRLPGGDAEDALVAHAAVEVEAVRAATDDDDGAEVPTRDPLRNAARLEPDREALVLDERTDDVARRGGAVERTAGLARRDEWPQPA